MQLFGLVAAMLPFYACAALLPFCPSAGQGVLQQGKVIKTGDTVKVSVLSSEYIGAATEIIDRRGNIKVPFLKRIRIAGRSADEAAKMLRWIYKNSKGGTPSVEVSIVSKASGKVAAKMNESERGRLQKPRVHSPDMFRGRILRRGDFWLPGEMRDGHEG
jgi:hypothetical protein